MLQRGLRECRARHFARAASVGGYAVLVGAISTLREHPPSDCDQRADRQQRDHDATCREPSRGGPRIDTVAIEGRRGGRQWRFRIGWWRETDRRHVVHRGAKRSLGDRCAVHAHRVIERQPGFTQQRALRLTLGGTIRGISPRHQCHEGMGVSQRERAHAARFPDERLAAELRARRHGPQHLLGACPYRRGR